MAFTTRLPAQWGSAAVIAASDVEGEPGKPVRLVNLNGEAHQAQSTSIAVYATGYQNAGVTLPGGPLVALANFSGAGGGGQIEFDVPCNLGGAVSNHFDVIQGGGAMVCFPCANVDLQVRNDGNFIPNPSIPGGLPISFRIGHPQSENLPRAQAVSGIGSKTGRLTRSVWLLNTAGTAAPFLLATPVPPFARTFRLFRQQSVPASLLTVQVAAPSLQPMDSFDLAGNVLSPDFVVGCASHVVISPGPGFAGTLSSCVLVFTLQMGGE